MTRRVALPLVILAATAVVWWILSPGPASRQAPATGGGSAGAAAAASPTAGTTTAPPVGRPTVDVEQALPDLGRSELADHLNAPDRTIDDDLKAVHEIFVAWLLALRPETLPIGENREVTAALTGANRIGMAFVPRNHPAINGRGELCDRWGTPFRFHPLSRTQMEIRSAGPDRRFGTPDDREWAPWAKNF